MHASHSIKAIQTFRGYNKKKHKFQAENLRLGLHGREDHAWNAFR
jgi:hypothetical protein